MERKSPRVNVSKKGIRILGISESFIKRKAKKSILAGVVMRADGIIDGFSLSSTTVGGKDATERIISLYKCMKRGDINFVLLNGCVISWFNIIDLDGVYKKIKKPLICATYEASEGLEKYLKEYFRNDWKERYEIYLKTAIRHEIELHTGKTIFARILGLERNQAKELLNKFTFHGAIPEPLRIARLLARSILRSDKL